MSAITKSWQQKICQDCACFCTYWVSMFAFIPGVQRCSVDPEWETGSWNSGHPVLCGSQSTQYRSGSQDWLRAMLDLRYTGKKKKKLFEMNGSWEAHVNDVILRTEISTFNSAVIISANDWPTWSATVSAGLIAGHVSKLSDDGSGKFLKPAVLEVELVSSQCSVQGLLLTVLQHWHPTKVNTHKLYLHTKKN